MIVGFLLETTSLFADIATPRLSPIPQEVQGIKQVRLDLNGQWDFNPTPPDQFWKTSQPQGPGWAKIHVPGEWVMQGFIVPDNEQAAYIKQISIAPEWKNKRIKLRCDGVYSLAKVYVNGIETGNHLGGFTPFEFDITSAVLPGKENCISLAIVNNSPVDSLASGSKYAVYPLGGITRNIVLFAVKPVNIASLHVNTAFDPEYKNAALTLTIKVANESASNENKLNFKIQLTDPAGKVVNIPAKIGKAFAAAAGQTTTIELSIPVTSPLKWDSEHPNLYTLSCSLVKDGKTLEKVVNRVGFRQIEVRGNELFVNNVRVKLRGVNRHETHPFKGRAVQSPEFYRRDVDLFRQANVNYIRTSHYPPPPEFLEACDELGMFVEVEAPFCWTQFTPATAKQVDEWMVPQAMEMVEAHRNHPSVLMWSMGNESPEFKNKFLKLTESIGIVDSSRPRNFSGCKIADDSDYCEIGNIHYPTGKGPEKYGDADRPIIFDEYTHLNCYNRQEILIDPGLRDFWGLGFSDMWKRMYEKTGILGGAIWGGIDALHFLPDGRVMGHGTWGIIDEYRRPKPEYWHVKKAYSPVKIMDQNMPAFTPGRGLIFKVDNQSNFTDLGEMRFEWTVGKKSGIAAVSGKPRTTALLTIPVSQSDLSDGPLTIKAVSPQGFAADIYQFKPAYTSKPDAVFAWCKKPVLTSDANEYSITTASARYKVSKKTGNLTANVNNIPVLLGGPELMVLPLNGVKGFCLMGWDHTTVATASCSNWNAKDVGAAEVNDAVVVTIGGEYKEADGKFIIKFEKSLMTVTYDFNSTVEVDPRQIGAVFRAARSFDTLSWERKTQWNYYPEDHIGRPAGTAKASYGTANTFYAGPRFEPSWSWAHDGTQWGSNDFRSTKLNIFHAQLADSNDTAVQVISDGNQHFRSWIEGKTIKLLVADYANEGNDMVFDEHVILHKPLKPGSHFSGTARFYISSGRQFSN